MFQIRTFEELTDVAGGPPAGSGGGVGSELVVSIAMSIYLTVGRGWGGVWFHNSAPGRAKSKGGSAKGRELLASPFRRDAKVRAGLALHARRARYPVVSKN